jgi:hypothetical protein
MLGSNPSAASVASTDPGGCPRHPLFAVCLHKLPIGRGIKALNPGGCGGKAPAGHVAHTFLLRAHSHNAYEGIAEVPGDERGAREDAEAEMIGGSADIPSGAEARTPLWALCGG